MKISCKEIAIHVSQNHESYVKKVCAKWKIKRELSEHVISEYVDFLIDKEKIYETGNLESFIIFFIRNKIIDYKRRDNLLLLDSSEIIFTNNTGLDYDEKDKTIYRRIRPYIYKLDDIDKTLLIMRYGIGMKYKEISSFLEMPLGTTKVKLLRAKENLTRIILYSDKTIEDFIY